MCHCLIAPDENMALFHRSLEKVLIFPRPEFRSERLFAGRENSLFQQHIAGSPLPPVDNKARGVSRPFIKPALNDPLWRLFVKERLHRSKDAIDVILVAGFE